MFGLALSICPLAISGYDFANRPKYAAYCPCCGFPGVENSPEASIVYLLTKKTDDRKPVCLMDVRSMGCSARISKEFSSSLLKNKDPKQFRLNYSSYRYTFQIIVRKHHQNTAL